MISAFDGDVVEFELKSAVCSGAFNTDMLPNELEAYSIIAFASESVKVGSPILNATLLSFKDRT